MLSLILVAPFSASAALTNPLGTSNLQVIFGRLIRSLLQITGGLALLMFIWGGFLYLTSGGNDGRIKQGKETLKWAFIGLVIILSAYVIVNTLIEAFTTPTISESGAPFTPAL